MTPIKPVTSIVAVPGLTGAFKPAATAKIWMNQCIEEVPQSNWGMVYQTNTDTGEVIRTDIMCDPYGPPPAWVPAPN